MWSSIRRCKYYYCSVPLTNALEMARANENSKSEEANLGASRRLKKLGVLRDAKSQSYMPASVEALP